MNKNKSSPMIFAGLIFINCLVAFFGMYYLPYSYQTGASLSDTNYIFNGVDTQYLLQESYEESSNGVFINIAVKTENSTGFIRDRGGVYDWGMVIGNTYVSPDDQRDVKIHYLISYSALYEKNISQLHDSTWVQIENETYWGKSPELFWAPFGTSRHYGYYELNGTYDADWRNFLNIDVIEFGNIHGFLNLPIMGVGQFFQEAYLGNVTISNNGTLKEEIRIIGSAFRIFCEISTYHGLFNGWNLNTNTTLYVGNGQVESPYGSDS